MKTKYLLLLSEIIDKMDIKEELQNLNFNTGNEKEDKEKLGTALITLLITRLYKCEKEVYNFIAEYKGYYPKEPKILPDDSRDEKNRKNEEYEEAVKNALEKASEEDVISIFKDVAKIPGVSSFLSIA
jgi:hypothetical protein